MSIKLTGRDIQVLHKMQSAPSLETATSSRGWQPTTADVAQVNDMIARGILQKTPGFDSIELTEAGRDAAADHQDRAESRRAAERGW